ncbi:MAG: radical SAM family heme chaperone HemW [Nitrospirae bacterium]|nr:radical SAM family heme chaperone HemW [Nitrospirota bacterium]
MPKTEKSFGIYLNFPFCPGKCHFCSFGSRMYHQPVVIRYLEAILSELSHYRHAVSIRNRVVSTIYIGGGTPTLISEDLPRLINEIRNQFDLEPAAEISLEAHPSGIQTDRLIPLIQAGFNRISLGVQSFHGPDLEWMNRGHTVQEIYSAFRQAREAGFENINIDLIYGLPGQTIEQWERNLYSAINLSPEHLSIYGLTVEEKTYLDYLKKQGKFEESEDDLQADMYLLALRMLDQEGYHQYEVSNFARPGFESRHNLHYWSEGDFLGIGSHAASYIAGVHSLNETTVEGYVRKVNEKGTAIEELEVLDPEGQFKQALVFGLRKKSGIKLSNLKPEYEPYFRAVLPRLFDLVETGFLKQSRDVHFSLTEKGLLFSDHVSMILI